MNTAASMADAPVPTIPVGKGLSPRLRWVIAGGAVVAALAIVAVALAVLGARPVPPALTYIPRNSVVVAELRPDLPGDQFQRVGNLLAHFPGFKDQSNLVQKLDESLARITSSVSNGRLDYGSRVKPWLAGPLFAAAGVGQPASGSRTDWVVVFTTDATATCDAWTGGSHETETYRGLVIGLPRGGGEATPSCAMDDRQAVVGSLAGVKAALDAHADHTGIDGAADYRAARDRLGGDRLATLYASRDALADGMSPASLASLMPTLPPEARTALEALPAWLIAGVRAEDNALVADLVVAPFNPGALPLALPSAAGSPVARPSLLAAPPAHSSALAPLLPADTAMLYELHGTGVALQNVLTILHATPELGPELGQVDAALGVLGGAEGLVGWVGDGAFVVLSDGTTADAGLVLLAPDEATAKAKAEQLASLVRLAGLSGRASVTLTETTVDDTPVTLADFGELGAPIHGLLAPYGLDVPPGTHLILSIAAHGSAVVIGSGERFARQVIETKAGSSLADQASYRTAVGLASARNSSQLYLAAGPLRGLIEAAMPESDRARYESDVKPYLEPVDALLETVTVDDAGVRVRLVLTVK